MNTLFENCLYINNKFELPFHSNYHTQVTVKYLKDYEILKISLKKVKNA